MTRNEFIRKQMEAQGISRKKAKELWRVFRADDTTYGIVVGINGRLALAFHIPHDTVKWDCEWTPEFEEGLHNVMSFFMDDRWTREPVNDFGGDVGAGLLLSRRAIQPEAVKPGGTVVADVNTFTGGWSSIWLPKLVDGTESAYQMLNCLAQKREMERLKAPEGVTIH